MRLKICLSFTQNQQWVANMTTKKIVIPVYLQDVNNLNGYRPQTIIGHGDIPYNHYVGEFTCYYDNTFRGERDAVISLTGDGGTGGNFTDSEFGMSILGMGFVVLEPLEPTTNVVGAVNKESPFPVNSSLVDVDPRHLMRARAGHIHKAMITGLQEIERRAKLLDGDVDKLQFSLSGKYTVLAQSRGSRSGFYLANCNWTYPSGLLDKYKYLDRVDYWFLAGFPFETSGVSVSLKPQLSARTFSNMLCTSPRHSKLVICANDTDNLTGSDIRRILMYCVPDSRRKDLSFINTEANGHFTEGVTQIAFMQSIINNVPIQLQFSNKPGESIPMLNLLGDQAQRSSDVYPTPATTI